MLEPACECGLRYVIGHPDDEKNHARIHADYERGPVLPVLEILVAPRNLSRAIYLQDRRQRAAGCST